jgi:CAAX protease family protein
VIPEAVPPPAAATSAAPAARPPVWGAGAALALSLAVLAAWGIAQVTVFVGYLMAGQLLGGARGPLTPGGVPHLGLALSLTTLAAAPVGTALTLLFARLRRGAPIRDYLGLRPPSARQALLWAFALALLLGGYDLLARALDRPVNPPVMVEMYQTAVWPPLFWLAVVAAAPLFEETLFRGFLLPSLAMSRLGRAGAVVLTSALFAALHLQYDLFDMAAVLALGALLAAARLASGSILLTFGMHVVTNLLALVQIATAVSM